jgi:protein phosphatase PTC7
MATGGLFDNVHLDAIQKMALEWEQKHGFLRSGDIAHRERRWAMGNSLTIQSQEHINEFAQSLVELARANSLDPTTDSPFALLAKENDIMWSGGMPDDITILALHVVILMMSWVLPTCKKTTMYFLKCIMCLVCTLLFTFLLLLAKRH